MGQNPSEILVTPAGMIGYVSIQGENGVKVLDLQAGAVVEEVPVGPEPDTMQLTNDGRTLVVALRGTPAHVALVDTNDYTRVRWTQLDGTTTGHQWLSADGGRTFVAVEGARAGIGFIDNHTGQTVASYSYPVANGATTPARPHGVFYDAERLTPSPRSSEALEGERRDPSHRHCLRRDRRMGEGQSEMAGIQLFEPHTTQDARAQLPGAISINKEES